MRSLLQNIGDYQILEKLGRGGMADVYLALDRKNNRRVALKLVERGGDPEAQEILLAERLGAELQQRISLIDPRVPQINGFGDLEGYFFIEMEFVEGNDLSAVIGSGGLKAEDAARIGLELCSILHNAHGMSLRIDGRELRAVVHGDIKPRNIRIDTTGKVRVLDFGIAKGLSITRRLTSNVFGSIAYSSPERLETGNIDEMSDLWSVGVVLYEMAAGKLPFEANSTERLETIIRSRGVIRPLQDSCPAELRQIIYKSLARSSGSRYRNAAEFGADLEAYLSGTATLAAQENEQTRRTSAIDDVETRRTAVVPQSEPAGSRPDSLNRTSIKNLSRAKKWILGGSLALLLGVGAWEGTAIRAAARLKPDLLQSGFDADSAWVKYQGIRDRSLLGFAPLILQGPVRDVLSENCERTVNEYRNSDSPTVREGNWIRCKRNMLRIAELNASDRKSEAMLEYADGHILRINRKGGDAIAAFQRAAGLQPRWPDPYLGMARTYIYNLGDLDRGMQALERARELGHSFGRKELAMLAYAHRRRGLQELENANLMQGTDQEKEFLKRAETDLKDALRNYLQIAPWGDSTAQILSIQDSLDEVEQRLAVLNAPNPLLPWNWFR